MMADKEQGQDSVLYLLEHLDKRGILSLIHENGARRSPFKNIPAYHTIVRCLDSDQTQEKVVTQLIYLLTLHGADINFLDQNGDIALLVYLREADPLSDGILQAFLRCGSDITLKNKSGEDVLGYILQADEFPRHVKARVLEYMPGIWRAVETDDAMTVRRLINQWCSIHVEKDDVTVLQLAFNKGTENIIRVISGIGSSMDLVHAVLAGDIQSVKTILKSGCKYNINLKNMSDRGATPLFYAMCENDKDLVDLLLKYGARVDIGMQAENELEMPLYFVALSMTPQVNTGILQHTIPVKPIPVDQLFYKGLNVVFYCIENDIDVTLFDSILHRCSANVLTQHIKNTDARNFAKNLAKDEYVAIIDQIVTDWCMDDSCHDNRNILALHGYEFSPSLCLNSNSVVPLDNQLTFLQMLPEYEDYKSKLRQAVEDGDLSTVKEMLCDESWSSKGLTSNFCDSRVAGDGQPLLHKAVLRKHVDVVREIAHCLVYKSCIKLDSIKDQFFRTAFHYAYGMEDGKDLVFLLEDLGMSEFTMDKDGRSPLAFKDRRGLTEMKELIQYQILQDFSEEEPDPWSTPLPLPIVGYLTKCLHEHRHKKKLGHNHHHALPADKITHTEKRNDQMYTKVDDKDFYQTEKLTISVGDMNLASKVQRENGSIGNKVDHYQIPETDDRTCKILQNDTGNNYQSPDEINSFEASLKLNKTGRNTDFDSDVTDSSVANQEAVFDESADNCSSSDVESLRSDHDSSDVVHDANDDDDDDVDDDNPEDYDGDYSDLESENEQDVDKFSNYCAIL